MILLLLISNNPYCYLLIAFSSEVMRGQEVKSYILVSIWLFIFLCTCKLLHHYFPEPYQKCENNRLLISLIFFLKLISIWSNEIPALTFPNTLKWEVLYVYFVLNPNVFWFIDLSKSPSVFWCFGRRGSYLIKLWHFWTKQFFSSMNHPNSWLQRCSSSFTKHSLTKQEKKKIFPQWKYISMSKHPTFYIVYILKIGKKENKSYCKHFWVANAIGLIFFFFLK